MVHLFESIPLPDGPLIPIQRLLEFRRVPWLDVIEDVHQLDEDGLGCVHGGGGIVYSFPCRVFSITWCFRKSAASSPRPLICRRSR